ncbi:MAG: type III-B CRISPR module RAMP protein Cmr6 [Syntrophomonadaceae bacterium]|nr:type III-B CRISPR module RAMP protein Cmr6 [Syntrophomonadaceae bacterium]
MDYHPEDTVKVFRSGITADNLWYKVHYFQRRNLDESTAKGNYPLNRELSLGSQSEVLLAKILAARRKFLENFASTHEVMILRGKADARIVAGIGAAHVRETSLTLHPVYGIPYIPGSSVKGLLRHWFVRAFASGELDRFEAGQGLTPEQEDLRKLYHDVFGSQERKGLLLGFDVFLAPNAKLIPDVMTVHYPNYYRGQGQPEDSDSPVPISFYTVKTAGVVEFVLAVEKNPGPERLASGLSSTEILELAGDWLAKALSELGIGSKTSSGYGYFREFTKEILKPRVRSKEVPPTPSTQPETPATVDAEGPEGEACLASRISRLNPKVQRDVDLSKGELYKQVIDTGDVEAARALFAFWEKTGDAKGGSKKQQQKVSELNLLLKA